MTRAWHHTSRGRALDLDCPSSDDVDLAEVARSIGQLCRYAGGTLRYYSVAEHCALIAQALRRDGYDSATQLAGLLHDAPEAYLGDLTWPVQQYLWERSIGARLAYRELHDSVHHAILGLLPLHVASLVLDPIREAAVSEYDLRILHDERDELLAPCEQRWDDSVDSLAPLGVEIRCWDPDQAGQEWAHLLETLVAKVQS